MHNTKKQKKSEKKTEENIREISSSSVIDKSSGKLGVLFVGLGAVTTTTIAGIYACRKGLSKPFGSLTQMQRIRLGKRTENNSPLIKEVVPLAGMNDLVFAAWDPIIDDAYTAAKKAEVLNDKNIEPIRKELQSIKPMKAVFDRKFVKNIDGPNVKRYKTKHDAAKMLIDDIEEFKVKSGCKTAVMINCASTERYIEKSKIHEDLELFETAMKRNSDLISPAMIYAYAAMKTDVPYANGTPSLAADTNAIKSLANHLKIPIAGKDFKTGQTFMKTVIAPALKARMLGLDGWFSTNILGNRDGEVLADPGSFKSKEVSKLSVLDTILQSDLYPDLYGGYSHQVHINYYKPRGDNKEGWDNIDIFGWMDKRMQIKVNFLCRDSILAAPIVLDLALFLDLAKRAKMFGVQEWLSFYFKSPMTTSNLIKPEHDLFIQHIKLKNTLRQIIGKELITHVD